MTHTSTRLRALDGFVKEIQKQAKKKSMSDEEVMNMRLAEDMFAFGKQIQVATDNAKGCVSRLTGTDAPVFEDNETTLDELLTRIEKTINYINTFNHEDFIGSDARQIELPYFPGMHFTGAGYMIGFYLPNFHFHAVTAYNICRMHGFEIGKKEFMMDIPLIPNQ